MKYVEATLIAGLAILSPIKGVIVVGILLIIIDLVSGIWAAKKRGEAITSAGFRRTVTKLFVFNTAIIMGFLVEKYMIGSIFPVSKMVAGVIGLVEFKSILENLNSIYGINLFQTVIAQLGSKNEPKNPQ
jgi:phage-related holin